MFCCSLQKFRRPHCIVGNRAAGRLQRSAVAKKRVNDPSTYDAIIVGGGPAGLSAALVLSRCRRRVLVCDTGQPRNAASREMHGFLTRDGVKPAEFLRRARAELEPYRVEIVSEQVVMAKRAGKGFVVTLASGRRSRCRKLLLATGVLDQVPDFPGTREMYGRSVFHCPYCDGWEVRDQPVAVYGPGRRAVGLALSLKTWSEDIVLLTGGRPGLRKEDRERLARNGVVMREDRILRLEGSKGRLQRIVFARGDPLERRALFFHTGQYQRSPLGERLGCEFNRRGTIRTNRLSLTCVEGLYCAGDASEDVQLVIVAAAEGAKAAFAMNTALQKDEIV